MWFYYILGWPFPPWRIDLWFIMNLHYLGWLWKYSIALHHSLRAFWLQAFQFPSISQRRAGCKVLFRNQGNLRLAMSMSSHTLRSLTKERAFRDTPAQLCYHLDWGNWGPEWRSDFPHARGLEYHIWTLLIPYPSPGPNPSPTNVVIGTHTWTTAYDQG